MEGVSAYHFLIAVSLIVILSYFFNILSKRTNIPSVLMLIVTGILLNIFNNIFGFLDVNLMPLLELLGIVGLIMIVLEAALDLKLERSKWPMFLRAFSIAAFGLVGSAFAIAWILDLFIEASFPNLLLYAIPMSIISSAIVLPSVGSLDNHKKEFLIYESTFSDILGIMFFYMLTDWMGSDHQSSIWLKLSINVGLTIGISLIASYVLIFIFQNISSKVKLFLLISVLILLYSIGKMMHLSSLLIILVFGLILNNYKLFFFGFLKRYLQPLTLKGILVDFRLVTIESAFVVRTFFFVIFGATIVLSDLISLTVLLQSTLILALIYALRWLLFRGLVGRDIFPQVFISPRGLITILLFYAIPAEFNIATFENGTLLYVILVSSSLMSWSLIKSKQQRDAGDDIFAPDPNTIDSISQMAGEPGAAGSEQAGEKHE